MSDSKSFPPTFSFSTSSTESSSSPGNGNFTFSAGERTERRRTSTTKSVKKSNPPSGLYKTASSSSFSFQNPSIFFVAEKINEKANSKETACENGIPKNAKTRFTVLSAITGTIPCYFEGSSYSSQPTEPSCFATGKDDSTKNDKGEKCVPNPSASQIMVSRLLKGIPQSPHFWPLRGYSEAAKQSLIYSWDKIFEESVDQIQSLQLTGFSVAAKRLWDTTQELQMMGYNVVPLRRRLIELSDVVHRRTRHRVEKMSLKSKATRHMMEKNKLEFEIVKLKAQAEAEKASFDDIMDKVAKIEDEMPSFNDIFSKLAVKPL